MASSADRQPIGRAARAERVRTAVSYAVSYIDAHYGEPVILARLADDLGLSVFCLSRAFKRATHVSFRTYLLHARIARAKTLLQGSDNPITEIAQTVGFGDLPRFDKVFKQLVGTSPSAFRVRSRPPAVRSDDAARNYYPRSRPG